MSQLTKQQIDAVAEWIATKDTRLYQSPSGLASAFIEDFTPKEKPLPKITDLSNTKIWIGYSHELSEKIQLKAFDLGWKWAYSESVANVHEGAIYFDAHKAMTYGSNRENFLLSDGRTEIFPEQILDSKNLCEEYKETALGKNSAYPSQSEQWDEQEMAVKKIQNEHDLKMLYADKSPKAYILQNDLPGVKAGSKVIRRRLHCEAEGEYTSYKAEVDASSGLENYAFPKDFVENNPSWFAEEEDKNENPGIASAYIAIDGFTDAIGKFPNIVTVAVRLGDVFVWNKGEEYLHESSGNIFTYKYLCSNPWVQERDKKHLLYSKKDMEHCFNTSRSESPLGGSFGFKYDTFEDYLKSAK